MRTADTDSVDAILDVGAAGLRFFEVFVPRYREWTGHTPTGGDYFALAAQYDQQRGMDLESLRNLATVLGEELDGRLGDQAATQPTRFGEVSAYWNGSPAADDARQFFTATGATITSNIDLLRTVHSAATTAVNQIDSAVRTKADTIKNEFVPDTAAGKSPQQIDWFIDLAQGRGDTSQSVQDRLRSELPGYVEGSDPVAGCRTWLDKDFVPEIDAMVARFTTVCSQAHTAVTGAYEQLVTAVEGIDPSTFLSPGGTPAADSELTSTPGQPVFLAAVGAPLASTHPGGETEQQDPGQPVAGVPQAPASQGTPPGLALTSTPAGVEISESADLGTESNSGVPAGAGTPSNSDDSSAMGNAPGPNPGSTAGGESSPPPGNSSSLLPAETGTPGEWTPADIVGMVNAVGTITGNIPNMITAVSTLAGNLDEIINAAGDATAKIIDAADNQPATPPASAQPETPVETGAVGNDSQEEQLAVNLAEDAADEGTAETPEEEQPVESRPGTTGDDQGQGPRSGEPAPALGTGPALAASVSSLRGLQATPPAPQATVQVPPSAR
ncbi:hypothetical protein [Nocardia carnea]|uniref:Uncharacterized protein n=1 Tax=Nocardia carnea TaxID=37328 RepID=A0ABW7TPP4_9NOCA|nr:hypothetical protein [Nocardia carnea]